MEDKRKNIVKVTIRRCNPAEGKKEAYVTYEIPIEMGWSVSNLLNYINENLDGGVAHYISCRKGLCGGCIVKINGKARLACMEIVTSDIMIEPISKERVIKDFVCLPR